MDSSTNIEDTISAVTSPTAAQPPNTVGGNAGSQFSQQSRSIGMIRSGPRHTNPSRHISAVTADEHDFHSTKVDLDSHADTCTLGANFTSKSYLEKECNVTP